MTGPRPVIFVGPSLPAGAGRQLAAQLLDAEWLPPAREGDLDAVLARVHPPAVIGLIDGVVPHREAPSPREVLRTLERSVAVFGSSGLGALRAVECGRYGMVGVGRIYEAYRSGSVDADDAVTVVTDAVAHLAMTDSLMNIRYGLDAAVTAGVTTALTADQILTAAGATHFSERTVAAVLSDPTAGLAAADRTALACFLTERTTDVARDDALELLAAVRRSTLRPLVLWADLAPGRASYHQVGARPAALRVGRAAPPAPAAAGVAGLGARRRCSCRSRCSKGCCGPDLPWRALVGGRRRRRWCPRCCGGAPGRC